MRAQGQGQGEDDEGVAGGYGEHGGPGARDIEAGDPPSDSSYDDGVITATRPREDNAGEIEDLGAYCGDL